MKEGFIDEIHRGLIVDELSLLNLTATSALGSSYLAAEKIDCPFVKPYDENVQVFFHYKRDNYGKIENQRQSQTRRCIKNNKDETIEMATTIC